MKIGVFLCTCGATLANTLEYSELETFAQTLPKVAHLETRTDYCQQQALENLSQIIKKKKLDRIVMAGCSPQLHGYHFEETASNAGLTAGQITYANIREHCAWVHTQEPEHATAKAKRLIRAAVNRAAKQQPIPTKQFPVTQEVLVIGGGIAGIQSALDLANQGTKVHLVERTPTIGGVMAVLVKTFPSDDCAICLPGSEDVILDNGSFTPIGSLAENLGAEHDIEFPEYPRTFSYETGLIKVNEVIAGQKLLSPSNLVEIMTSTGARVRCTPNHKVLVDKPEGSVWVRADQLKIGERVYSPRKLDLQQTSEYWIVDLIPDNFKAAGVNPSQFQERLRMCFGNLKRAALELELDYRKLFDGKWLSLGELKRICEALQLSWIELRGLISTLTYRGSHNVPLGTQILNKKFLYLLGLLASDGTIEKNRIRFTNTDRKLINLFVKIYQTLFPSKAAHISKITSKKSTQKHRYVVQVKNQVLYHICNQLDVKGTLKPIFQFEDKLIAAFLGGFFDGDGSVSKIQKDNQLIGKITLHPGQDYTRGFGLHLLLKRLGIISKVYDYESRVIVDISGKHEIFLFLSKIHSYHSQRSRQLKDLEVSIIHHGIKKVGLFDQVPLIAGRHLQRVKQRYRIPLKSFPLSHSNTLRILRQECRMTTDTLLRIHSTIESIVEADDVELVKLRHLTKSSFFLDKIKNLQIVPSDNHYVYDITVQNSHNFIPNGAFVVSNCIEGPKMADVSMHPNITLHCFTEVEEVTPDGKDFDVRLRKKATYVDWDKCTGCMSCTEKCPTRVTDEWTWGLGKRRAIYMPFSQSVPRKCTIDADYCKKILDDKCGVCEKVCPADAIDYEMKDAEVNLRVGGIVLATGFEEFDPSVVPELNFTENPDVITQMQLARLLDTVGPMEGKLVCPSDGRKPKKMVMIQCVGSRDERYDWGCSRYCCMAALKHAVLTKVEQDADMDITIVARDIRAAGKGFEEYFVRACDEYGVKVVYRGDEVKVTQQNGKTKVVYTDEEGGKQTLPADLVILSCAMVPSKGTTELAQTLGLNIDEHGFFEAIDEKVALTRTSIPNIVLSGACHGPKDVPESVAQASAAAQEVASWLATAQTAKTLDTASVNKDLCNACGLCVTACNYEAIEFTEDKKCVAVDEVRCIGCGECFAICPVGAIAPLNTNQEVIDATVKGIVDNAIEGPSPIVIGFACKECSYRAIDEAGEKQLQYPANLHVVEVPCTGGISTPQILRTLEAGAEGVVLFACDTEVCHYGRGAGMASTRAKVVRNVLSQSGALPERVRVVNMIGRDAKEFADAAKNAVDAILKGANGG